MRPGLWRRCVAEFVGTLFLLAVVVGSGIMGEKLSGGNVGLALLANSLATGAGLVAILLALGGVSGAHLNPLVTLAELALRRFTPRETVGYVAGQTGGAIAGVMVAHAMFGLPVISLSRHVRSGAGQIFGEFVATFGLFAVIWGCGRHRAAAVPFAVGGYIAAAYWFTSSTSFANPAVTLARCLSDTFAGIRPVDVLPFVVAQMAGAGAATVLFQWMLEGRE